MECVEQVKNIETRDDFVVFMQQLLRDRRQCPEQWENASLEAYLEAIAAWVKDMDGYFYNRNEPFPEHLTWRNLGEILLAARMYE
jgi:hypothetical protein